MADTIRVMMLGDISGTTGMGALFLGLSSFVKERKIDFVIANGENAAGGFGIAIDDYNRIRSIGVDVITSGNHIWQKEEILPLLDSSDDILRPINYPEPCPGKGLTVKKKGDLQIAVINAQGRISMPLSDDPFRKLEATVERVSKQTKLIFIDLHAENAEEKEAIAFDLDGRVTAVCGTHTHVQTADERILPGGTAYITDLGITGVTDAVIGSDIGKSIERQLTQLPIKSEPAEGEAHMQGVIIEADRATGRAISIERFTR